MAMPGGLYFSAEPDRLRRPMRLRHSKLHIEESFSINCCVRLDRHVLVASRGADGSLLDTRPTAAPEEVPSDGASDGDGVRPQHEQGSVDWKWNDA